MEESWKHWFWDASVLGQWSPELNAVEVYDPKTKENCLLVE